MTNLDYNKITEAVNQFENSRKEFMKKMEDEFHKIFREFFEVYPEIAAIGWNQYTPYFNDGDTCEFSVHDKYPVAAAVLSAEVENEDDEILELDGVYSAWQLEEWDFPYAVPSKYAYDDYNKKGEKSYYASSIKLYEKLLAENGERFGEVSNAWKAFAEAIDKIPDDVYRASFGDHVFVLATKNGFEVKELDHD